jgi:hypothetical protein
VQRSRKIMNAGEFQQLLMQEQQRQAQENRAQQQ